MAEWMAATPRDHPAWAGPGVVCLFVCKPTSLLREEPGGWCAPKAGATIEVGHEKKVDLGVLRGADHDGRVPESPFTTVDRVCVEFEVTM